MTGEDSARPGCADRDQAHRDQAHRDGTAEDFTDLIAALLMALLDDLGTGPASVAEITASEAALRMDLADFGLGSLDWIKLAVTIGNETGLELPESALVDARSRTIAGWAGALASAADARDRPAP